MELNPIEIEGWLIKVVTDTSNVLQKRGCPQQVRALNELAVRRRPRVHDDDRDDDELSGNINVLPTATFNGASLACALHHDSHQY